MGCLWVSLLLQNSLHSQSSMVVTAVAISNLREEQKQQQKKLKHGDKPTLKPTQPKPKHH